MLPNLIVPVLNRYDLLQRMLDSIDVKIAHLVIIDNGDAMDKMRFPEKAKYVHVIPLPGNLGVSASWNLGIKVLPHHDRWFFGSNDIILQPGDLQKLSHAKTNELTLTESFPNWQLFAVGEEVVRSVGLFDEAFHPAYFEDNDYLRRVHFHEYPVTKLKLGVHHDNSSTLRSSQQFQDKNNTTFHDNQSYYNRKVAASDFSAGQWSLSRRRRNEWLR